MIDPFNLDPALPDDRAQLKSLLTHILAKIAALEADPKTRFSVCNNSGFVGGYTGVTWPLLFDENTMPDYSAIFSSPEFREKYSAGAPVQVYGAGSPGLRRRSAEFDLPLRKVGHSEDPDVRKRLSTANVDKYGGRIITNEGYLDEPGFDAYTACGFEAPNLSPLSPVKLLPRSLSFSLPVSLSVEEFSKIFDAAMSPISLWEWASSAQGIAHFRKIGVPRERALRYTAYGYGTETSVERAREIMIFRPRRDGDRLGRLIEKIILDHLQLLPDGRISNA